MKNIKSIHFVGVKGVGVTPLAIIAKQSGLLVTGCDIADDFITNLPLEKNGIKPLVAFSGEHLKNIDMVITTGAHGGLENPEIKKALELKIPVITQGEALGMFMKGDLFKRVFKGISVAGCHGKTTTTAMVATILRVAGKDPSFVIGTGDISSLESSGNYGKGEYFVAEADEYATEPKYDKTPKFLWQFPEILIITNIEFDHPDLYKSLADVTNAYANLLKNVSGKTLIVNGDDGEIRKIIKNFKGNLITFGKSSSNKYILSKVEVKNQMTTFYVSFNKKELGKFETWAIGEHNSLNALAGVIAGIESGLSVEEVKKGLLAFKGTKRRLEFKGKLKTGALLYDDYAHHPTEIKKTLIAVKQLFPKKKIICIFQPHTYSRTKLLFEEFSSSFSDVYTVLITNIYPSQRESPDPTVSAKDLASAVKKNGTEAIFLPKAQDVVKYLKEKEFGDDYVLVTMGAGDIYKIEKDLL